MANWRPDGEDRWIDDENPSREIRKSRRAYEKERQGNKHFRPYDREGGAVYHQYENGRYLGQETALDKAQTTIDEKKSRRERGQPRNN